MYPPRRRTKIVAIALLLGVALVVARGSSAQDRKKSGPAMEIAPEEHDFGGVRQDQKHVHEFTVTNVGTEDLEIRRISTSCGCTAAITSARIVKPGESTTLRVILETRKYKGFIQKSISVASNDSKRVHTVRVKAFVEVPE